MNYLAFTACLLCVGCVPADSSQPGDPANEQPDASMPQMPMPDAPGSMSTCSAAATPPGNGHHNAGADCLSCHNGSNAAPKWTIAGTLDDATGAAPRAGATITIVDSANKTIKIVTASNGNFWTSQAVSLPLHSKVSQCPSTAAMNGIAGPSCNSCHVGTGTPGRIKLP